MKSRGVWNMVLVSGIKRLRTVEYSWSDGVIGTDIETDQENGGKGK